MRKLKFLLVGVAVFLTHVSFSKTYYCYVPGAGGVRSYLMGEVRDEVLAHGVPLVIFKISAQGTVKQRAAELQQYTQELLRFDPEARCHMLAYSMGGIVMRYAANHLTLRDLRTGDLIPYNQILDSQSSVSSPHRGTPLAEFLKENYPGLKPGMEDLSEEALTVFNDPSSPEYSPSIDGIPFYSWGTFVTSKEETRTLVSKIGYQYIDHYYRTRSRDPRNDGIVPLSSMSAGSYLGELQVSHDFMGFDTGERIRAADFMKAHWDWLTQGVPGGRQMASPMFHFAKSLLAPFKTDIAQAL